MINALFVGGPYDRRACCVKDCRPYIVNQLIDDGITVEPYKDPLLTGADIRDRIKRHVYEATGIYAVTERGEWRVFACSPIDSTDALMKLIKAYHEID